MRSTFDPLFHGFQFSNSNITWSWGVMSGTALCGGMSFASLDYFFNSLPIPTTMTPPAPGTPLHDYIYTRQMHAHGFAFPQLIQRSREPDRNSLSRSCSVEGAFGTIRQYLYHQRPLPILMGDADSPVSTNSHWVVVIGYEETDGALGKLYLYDNNHPARGAELAPDAEAGCLRHSVTQHRYGFYIPYVGYEPRDPRVPIGDVPMTNVITNPLGLPPVGI